ncbi:MAG: PAS domain S-box protein [Gemmatimonadetes bacterium]|nr:PAS domain S-box protein [Gemmatimonadota bacterium]
MERVYRVLLVEDDPEDRLLIEDILADIQQWRADVVWARSFDEGVRLAATGGFDIALIDYRLGVHRGVELLSVPAVQSTNLPVIILTGQPAPEIDDAAMAAGAEDFLSKRELDAAQLERAIRYAIETRRRHRVEARYRALIENSRDLISVLNPDGTIQYVSPSLLRILGFDPADKAGAHALGEVHPDDREAVERAFGDLLSDPGGVRAIRYRAKHKDGSWRVLDTVSQNLLHDPLIHGVIVNSWDITEQQRTQNALRDTANLLQQTLGSLEEAVFTVDLGTRTILRGNESTFRMFGHPPDVMIGASTRIFHVDDETHDAFGRAIRDALATGDRFRGDIMLRRSDDSVFPAEFTLSLMQPGMGVDAGVVAVVRDVTARVEQGRQRQFQAELLERVGQPVMAVDQHANVTYWNQACEDLTGWKREELLGRQVLDTIILSEDREVGLQARLAAQGGSRWDGEITLVCKDGGTRTVRASVTPAVNPDGSPGGRIAAGVDVSELKAAEKQKRRDSERARFQARLLDAVGQAVIATDLEGRVLYWNQAAVDLYGWTQAEAIGRNVTEVTPSLGSRAFAEEIMLSLSRGQAWSGEIELCDRDGVCFPALVTNAPMFDEDGRLISIVGLSSDLRGQKELEKQLQQAQKMEAIGRLAGGIAHDFNNLLTAINGHAEMIRDELPADSQSAEDIRQVLKASDRAAALTRQLLAFSRKQVLELRPIDLRTVVGDLEQMLKRLISERIEFHVDVGEMPAVARADPHQLGQVLMNLVINARDAVESGGRITVRVDHAELTEEDTSVLPWSIEPGRYARLSVQDTGPGIPPGILSHIFEPFFTTKPEGKGTGLGLSTVYGIVKQSGGHVLVDSVEGSGATFRVLLPLADAPAEETPRAKQETRLEHKGGTILLVEDDSAVRRLGLRVLERLGYTVLQAENGMEALEIAMERGAEIDLVVSDVVMPGLSGVELVDRLREYRPDIRVVLTSGYSEAELRGEVRGKGTAFLGKPFTPDALMRVVAQTLAD